MKVNRSDTQHSDTFPLVLKKKGRQKNIYFEKKQKYKSEEMLIIDGPTL